jgi:hypothetical protein
LQAHGPKAVIHLYFHEIGSESQPSTSISMKSEAKISRQLSFPSNWKRKSAVNFHFHGIGSESQPQTLISVVLEAKVNHQL